ncbi:MAG TPA: ATP-binding protein [Elusimicrobiota bacterium]|nr:ATP-binding protein [Elusimicrobiota bacterium]
MKVREPVVISWSGGKDSMLALHEVRASGSFDVISALTTVTQEYDRVCMHGVRRSLLRRQCDELSLPLAEIVMPPQPTNAHYEEGVGRALDKFRARGVSQVVFGDIFLEDLRAYRDRQLAGLGFSGIYPLWRQPSEALVRRFLALGYRTVLACVDTRAMPADFAGRELDESLLSALPPGVDPCGENGEFHTFVWSGPLFRHPIRLVRGDRVQRAQFMYCDWLEESPRAAPVALTVEGMS